jgi:Xaa-Pro aminopeptidase
MKDVIKSLKAQFSKYNIDGYIIPKNDEFFSEYSNKDRLKIISNFSGSAGYAVVLKDRNYLFVDSRYTIQAQVESGNKFKILDYEKIFNCKVFKNLNIGLDPALFTSNQIKKIFLNNKIKLINKNLIDIVVKLKNIKSKSFYSLSNKIAGENYKNKIFRIVDYLKKNNLDHIFITAPENVAWILNIRGYDNPNSPIPNSNLLISKNNKKYIIAKKVKLKKLIKEKKISVNEIIEPKNINLFFNNLGGKKISIDNKTCSINYEQLLNKRFKITKSNDPVYIFKSIKNKTEIKNMIKAHISDGVALTKFIYWIKEINQKKITEVDAQKKLEKFRQKNENYLFPSFDTIAGSGKNAAIVHYRANKKNTKIIKNKDIFLCDSGGQYKYGTTDVTRTLCFSKQSHNIKRIFTYVLKGHIAVFNTNLNKNNIGRKIDLNARKFLKKKGLDYGHGTGHGVGYFLNVHEGPQAISKYNSIKIKEGMILSNEPGFYKKNSFGIRIENLVYVKKEGKNLLFKNLTLAPIEKSLIDYKILTKYEKDYLFRYHLEVYSKISSFLSQKEKKWLAGFIQ